MSDKVYDHWKDPEWLELFYECHEDEWRREAMEDYEISDNRPEDGDAQICYEVK